MKMLEIQLQTYLSTIEKFHLSFINTFPFAENAYNARVYKHFMTISLCDI